MNLFSAAIVWVYLKSQCRSLEHFETKASIELFSAMGSHKTQQREVFIPMKT